MISLLKRKRYILIVCVSLGTIIPVLLHIGIISNTPKSVVNKDSDRNRGFRVAPAQKESDVAKRFEERNVHAVQTCHRIALPRQHTCQVNAVKSNLFPVGSYNMTMCTIEKSGSTFLKRILKVVNSPESSNKIVNPFDIKKAAAYAQQQNLKNRTLDDIKARMETTYNVVFVRDPFTRVFSGYLDKLYNVNTYYWFGLGTRIVQQERMNASKRSLKCGNDVTFSEFVSALVKKQSNEQCFDGHFKSSYNHCFPCNFTYTYIGKYETLKEDLFHVLSKEGLLQVVNLTNVDESNDIDSIVDGSKFAFAQQKRIETCMFFVDGLERFWRRLQCRGMLDKRSTFPFTRSDEATLTEAHFRETLLQAYREFDPQDRVLNRHESLSEAYRSLSESLIREFVEAFNLDFEIFGYSKSLSLTNRIHYKYLTL